MGKHPETCNYKSNLLSLYVLCGQEEAGSCGRGRTIQKGLLYVCGKFIGPFKESFTFSQDIFHSRQQMCFSHLFKSSSLFLREAYSFSLATYYMLLDKWLPNSLFIVLLVWMGPSSWWCLLQYLAQSAHTVQWLHVAPRTHLPPCWPTSPVRHELRVPHLFSHCLAPAWWLLEFCVERRPPRGGGPRRLCQIKLGPCSIRSCMTKEL